MPAYESFRSLDNPTTGNLAGTVVPEAGRREWNRPESNIDFLQASGTCQASTLGPESKRAPGGHLSNKALSGV